LNKNPDAFRTAAFDIIREGIDPSLADYLTALLAHHYLLVPWLIRPEFFTVEQAIRISERLVKYDPTAASTFTHLLSDMALRLDVHEDTVLRILAILGAVSAHPSTPLLTRFLNSANERVRSKAALLMGRVNHSVRWVENQLRQPDSRLRANALESLWGVATAEACAMFREAAKDGAPRVAGNAAAALYKAGQVDSLALLTELMDRPEPAWQATAAWAMGESGDARFVKHLERAAQSALAGPKENAQHALERIQKRNREKEAAGRLDVAAVETTGSDRNRRRIRISVWQKGPPPRPLRALPATDFVVREQGEPVFDYTVAELPIAASLAIGVVWPWHADGASAKAAAETLLGQKRQGDVWSIVPYVHSAEREVLSEAHHGPAAPRIVKLNLAAEVKVEKVNLDGKIVRSSDTSLVSTVLLPNDKRPSCASSMTHGLGQIMRALARARETPHILVFAEGGDSLEDADGLANFAYQNRLHLHFCVQAEAVPEPFTAIATATGGLALAGPDLAELIPKLCRNLTGYYEISWTPIAGDASVEIRSDLGCSEAVAFPGTVRRLPEIAAQPHPAAPVQERPDILAPHSEYC